MSCISQTINHIILNIHIFYCAQESVKALGKPDIMVSEGNKKIVDFYGWVTGEMQKANFQSGMYVILMSLNTLLLWLTFHYADIDICIP